MNGGALVAGVGTEQDFRALVEAMPVMVWTALPSGGLDYVNKHVLDYFGRDFGQMIEWGWVQVVHPDDLGETGARWSYALETGTPYRMEFRVRRASDGAYRWHLVEAVPRRDASGVIVHWYGYAADIHDLKGR